MKKYQDYLREAVEKGQIKKENTKPMTLKRMMGRTSRYNNKRTRTAKVC